MSKGTESLFHPRFRQFICPRCGRFGCLDLICHGGVDLRGLDASRRSALRARLRGMSVLDLVAAEVERQDRVHPDGYPATRDGVRLGLATAQDELDEALEAWRKAKRLPLTQHEWQAVKDELVQAAAVIVRTLREMPPSPEPRERRARVWGERRD